MLSFDNNFLDNPDFALSSSSSVKDNSLNVKNQTRSNKNSLTSNENFIDQKFASISVENLRKIVLNDIKNDLNFENIKNTNTAVYDKLISSYKDEIDNLKSEVYFLREQLKEKDSWLKNLIFTKSATESNKCYNHDDNELKLSISKMLEDVLSQHNPERKDYRSPMDTNNSLESFNLNVDKNGNSNRMESSVNAKNNDYNPFYNPFIPFGTSVNTYADNMNIVNDIKKKCKKIVKITIMTTIMMKMI